MFNGFKTFSDISGCTQIMDPWKCPPFGGTNSLNMAPSNILSKVNERAKFEKEERDIGHTVEAGAEVDIREIYFLIMHFLSVGPCRRTFEQFANDLLEHQLLPRRYHAWFSRSGVGSGNDNDNNTSFPLSYNKLVERYKCFLFRLTLIIERYTKHWISFCYSSCLCSCHVFCLLPRIYLFIISYLIFAWYM